ncbi:DMT family transporter [Candidatus Woesearchaeota archaeon]|nr:DMT family transporter [Candidatus Woesearchaeota archaeon]
MDWYIYILLSAVFIAFLNMVNKKILIHEHAMEFLSSRAPLVIIISLFLLPFVNFNIPLKVYVLIYTMSVLVSAGAIYLNKGLRHGEISTISPLTNISPVFLLIIAYFILGESPEAKQYFGVFLLILGAYSLEVGITNKGLLEPIKIFLKSKIIHYVIFSMVVFSITATFDKFIITNYTNFQTHFFLLMIFTSINYMLVDSYRFGYREIIIGLKKDFKFHLGSSIFLFLGNFFYFSAVSFPSAPISLLIPLKRTSTLFTTIFGGKLFHEENLLVKVLACIIMIWGAVFILL